MKFQAQDTITYREMVGRIFDGLHKPRRVVAIPRCCGARRSY